MHSKQDKSSDKPRIGLESSKCKKKVLSFLVNPHPDGMSEIKELDAKIRQFENSRPVLAMMYELRLTAIAAYVEMDSAVKEMGVETKELLESLPDEVFFAISAVTMGLMMDKCASQLRESLIKQGERPPEEPEKGQI